jgi:tRNA-(ms[2]io[6]A)-hydroxylase
MLGLKADTNPEWASVVLEDLEQFLTDHAYNEIKAAQSAMAVIGHHPEATDFVNTMSALAIEEMGHFEMVFEQIQKLNLQLGKETQNAYAIQLRKFFPKTKDPKERFIQKLMLSSLMEARSCERFSVLIPALKETYPELAQFYQDLFESEARHYRVFLEYARQFGDEERVNEQWQALLDYEANLIKELGTKPLVHG